MYSDELERIEAPLEGLFLDPNNPRFWTERGIPEISDKKIPEDKIQEEALKRLIEKFGVEELYFSILRNGFLPLDRIVVRPIQEHGGKYVVVEGNRRLAALKLLQRRVDEGVIAEEGIDDKYLKLLKDSISKIEVLLYKGTKAEEIAWIFQGVRHISGVRDWEPAQRARLVAKQIEEVGMTFNQAGQKFGLTAKAVGRLYRAYKGLQQMQEDEDYGPKAKNQYFSLFEEAYRNLKVREWLGWKENERKFANTENLKQFYSWIVPDEEFEDTRRIHDPKHVAYLAELLEKKRFDLIGQIDRHEVTIEEAKGRAAESSGPYDWRSEIEKAKQCVKGLPNVVFLEQGDELKEELLKLRTLIDQTLERCSV